MCMLQASDTVCTAQTLVHNLLVIDTFTNTAGTLQTRNIEKNGQQNRIFKTRITKTETLFDTQSNNDSS